MRKRLLLLIMTMSIILVNAQINPAVKAWLQNTTIKGSHYIKNNSTAIPDTSTANVQLVKYSADWVYIYTNGVPSYTTGPFLDNNPSLASSQNAIFKVSLKPQKNTGAPTPTTEGSLVYSSMGLRSLITAMVFHGIMHNLNYAEDLSCAPLQEAMENGIAMQSLESDWVLIVQKDTPLWAIIIIIKTRVHLIWI